MKRNGFTLIELLAVIVILAIIALIATPIILGIINDAREKANERSVELYASAVRNAIAAYQLTGTSSPESFSDLDIQYDGNVECAIEELYEDGSFFLEGCKVNNSTKEYNYGIKQLEKGKLSSVCVPAEEQLYATEPLEAGYKYECDVDPNKEGYDYMFYVLTTVGEDATNGSVNLIMDSNININGEAVKEGITNDGTVAWVLYKDYPENNLNPWNAVSTYGPLSVMNYLQTATTGWTNVNEQKISTFTECATDGICVDKTMTEYIVKARMPYYSEVSDYSVSANNAYLYDNLKLYCLDDFGDQEISCSEAKNIIGVNVEGLGHVNSLYGYWTLSSYDSGYAWRVHYGGTLYNDYVDNTGDNGVRPVINLTI